MQRRCLVRRLFLAISLFLAAVLVSSTASAVVDVEARYWFSTIDSEVKVSSGTLVGTDIDVVTDLGLDEQKNFFEGRLKLELGSHSLRYAFVPLKWDGSKALTQSVTFNGQTYTASTQVDTDLKLTYHRLGYEYDFIDLMDNKFGMIIELKYFDTEARLKAPALGLNEAESIKAPVPTVGLAAQVGLPFLVNIGGEITGVSLGSTAYLVDAEAAVNFKPAPFVVISGGYRLFKLHLENNDDQVDFSVKGPFLTLRADF